jgi:hypothetical protein
VSLNPPVSVLGFQLLARGGPEVVGRVWQISSAVVYALVVTVLLRLFPTATSGYRLLLMLLLGPLWSVLIAGQLHVALLIPASVALVNGHRKPTLAAICAGIVIAVKPQFLAWPILLFCTRHNRQAVVSLATAAGLSALPLFLGHRDWYAQWLTALTEREQEHVIVFPQNISVYGLLQRWEVPEALAMGAVALAFAAIVVAVAIRKPPVRRVYAIGTIAALLFAPLTWDTYATLLVPVFLSERRWPLGMKAVVAIFLIPYVLLVYLTHDSWLYAAALVALGAVLLYDHRTRP